MTIKEKYNIICSRIEEYKRKSAQCREIESVVANMERQITANVDSRDVEKSYGCIKKYWVDMPATNTFEIGDNVFFSEKQCRCFKENPCSVVSCPYINRNKQYKEQQRLYKEALMGKKLALRRIFERIKG